MTSPVRIAVVGCGLVTEQMHLPAALSSPAVEITALVDAEPARAAALARRFGLACARTGELTADVLELAEGVLIATPNHTHAAVARVALSAGRPVLVEKPLTTGHADALGLCGLAEANKAFIAVGFVTRHFPVVPLFKRLLDAGFFGRIREFEFEYGTKGGWAPASGYSTNHGRTGGGVLVVNGTHFLDRMLYWFGWPTSFRYADDNYGGIEANCRADLEWPGFGGHLVLSKTMPLQNRFVMRTDAALVEIAYAEPNGICIRSLETPDVETRITGPVRIAAADAFRLQIEEFARVIRYGGAPTVTGEQGAASVRLCEQFYAHRQQFEEPWAWYKTPEVCA